MNKPEHESTLTAEEKNVPNDKFQASKENWKKNNMKMYAFRLSKVSEKDMVDFLETKKPYYAYIKGLIRKDMESQSD